MSYITNIGKKYFFKPEIKKCNKFKRILKDNFKAIRQINKEKKIIEKY